MARELRSPEFNIDLLYNTILALYWVDIFGELELPEFDIGGLYDRPKLGELYCWLGVESWKRIDERKELRALLTAASNSERNML